MDNDVPTIAGPSRPSSSNSRRSPTPSPLPSVIPLVNADAAADVDMDADPTTSIESHGQGIEIPEHTLPSDKGVISVEPTTDYSKPQMTDFSLSFPTTELASGPLPLDMHRIDGTRMGRSTPPPDPERDRDRNREDDTRQATFPYTPPDDAPLPSTGYPNPIHPSVAALTAPSPEAVSPSNTVADSPEAGPSTTKPKPVKRRRATPSRRSVGASSTGKPPHFMGENNQIIRCICEIDEDDGLTIQCETCYAWQHASCFGYQDAESAPEIYFCELCEPRPVDPILARQMQLEAKARRDIEARYGEVAMRGIASLLDMKPKSRGKPKRPRMGSGAEEGGVDKDKEREKDREKDKERERERERERDVDGVREKDKVKEQRDKEKENEKEKEESPATMPPPPTVKPRRKTGAKPRNTKGATTGESTPAPSFPPQPSTEEDEYFRVEPWSLEFTPIKENIVRGVEARRILTRLYREWVDDDDGTPPPSNKKRSHSGPSGLPSPTETGTTRFSPDDIFPCSDFAYLAPPVPPITLYGANLQDSACQTSVRILDTTHSFLPLSYDDAVPLAGPYVAPAVYALYADQDVSEGAFLGEYKAEITDCETYRQDPINQYGLLGLPKPYVRPIGPPVNLILDARGYGSVTRFIRSGCHPNSVLRPILHRPSDEATPKIRFGVFASTTIPKNAEIVLGWEWDDSHSVHALRSLIAPTLLASNEPGRPGLAPNVSPTPQVLRGVYDKFDLILTCLLGTFSSCACAMRGNCAIAQMRHLVESKDEKSLAGRRGQRASLGPLVGAVRGWRRREMDVARVRAWNDPRWSGQGGGARAKSRSAMSSPVVRVLELREEREVDMDVDTDPDTDVGAAMDRRPVEEERERGQLEEDDRRDRDHEMEVYEHKDNCDHEDAGDEADDGGDETEDDLPPAMSRTRAADQSDVSPEQRESSALTESPPSPVVDRKQHISAITSTPKSNGSAAAASTVSKAIRPGTGTGLGLNHSLITSVSEVSASIPLVDSTTTTPTRAPVAPAAKLPPRPSAAFFGDDDDGELSDASDASDVSGVSGATTATLPRSDASGSGSGSGSGSEGSGSESGSDAGSDNEDGNRNGIATTNDVSMSDDELTEQESEEEEEKMLVASPVQNARVLKSVPEGKSAPGPSASTNVKGKVPVNGRKADKGESVGPPTSRGMGRKRRIMSSPGTDDESASASASVSASAVSPAARKVARRRSRDGKAAVPRPRADPKTGSSKPSQAVPGLFDSPSPSPPPPEMEQEDRVATPPLPANEPEVSTPALPSPAPSTPPPVKEATPPPPSPPKEPTPPPVVPKRITIAEYLKRRAQERAPVVADETGEAEQGTVNAVENAAPSTAQSGLGLTTEIKPDVSSVSVGAAVASQGEANGNGGSGSGSGNASMVGGFNMNDFLPSNRVVSTPSTYNTPLPTESPRNVLATPASTNYVPRTEYFPVQSTPTGTTATPSGTASSSFQPRPRPAYAPRSAEDAHIPPPPPSSYVPRTSTESQAYPSIATPPLPAVTMADDVKPLAYNDYDRFDGRDRDRRSVSGVSQPTRVSPSVSPAQHYSHLPPLDTGGIPNIPPVLPQRELPPHHAHAQPQSISTTISAPASASASVGTLPPTAPRASLSPVDRTTPLPRVPPTGPKVPPSGPRGSWAAQLGPGPGPGGGPASGTGVAGAAGGTNAARGPTGPVPVPGLRGGYRGGFEGRGAWRGRGGGGYRGRGGW